MKLFVRLFVLGLMLYLGMKLGLIKLFMLFMIVVGTFIVRLFELSPLAASVGILMFLLLAGMNVTRTD